MGYVFVKRAVSLGSYRKTVVTDTSFPEYSIFTEQVQKTKHFELYLMISRRTLVTLAVSKAAFLFCCTCHNMLEFIKALSPKTAVISAGRNNRYGHPHRELLERLEKAGVTIYRSDLQGAVTIR